MKKAKIIFFLVVFSFLSLIFLGFKVETTFAQQSYWDSQVGMGEVGVAFGEDPSSVEDIRFRIVRIINLILTFLGIIVVVLIIFAGFQWMTAAGNEQQVEKAQKILKNAIIGLVIIMLAWSITMFLMNRIRAIQTNSPYYLDPLY